MDSLPRLASSSDKKDVLNFCQNTFSWGDYIHEVWDNWINEGHLIVIKNDQIPVSMAHAGFYPDEKMIWIEGIRVSNNFRKKGLAQKMIHYFERLEAWKLPNKRAWEHAMSIAVDLFRT